MSVKKIYTTAEICASLGISRWTLNNWKKAGKIDFERRGHKLIFSPATVRAWGLDQKND